MTAITDIRAEEISDSRGNPTLLVTVLGGDVQGAFAVPSGASTGSAEAVELRDNDDPHGHMTSAIRNIETEIKSALAGMDVTDQRGIDAKLIALDGTSNKSRLGGNAIIGVSVAACKAAAKARGLELYAYLRTLADIAPSHKRGPFLYMNLVNGGKHASTRLAFQEYMIVPQTEFPQEALALGREVLRLVDARVLADYGPEALVIGDEGGIALDVDDTEIPLRIFADIREGLGERGTFRIALDIAASSFFESGTYRASGAALSKAELASRVAMYASTYDLLSVEDPFEESDFASFARLKDAILNTKIVGDDLTTTNVTRLQKAIEERSIGALIIKPNQIGTVSETLDTMALARKNGIDCIVSHRSGETMDTFISDLAYAFRTFGIKTGAPRTKERMAKIQRLIEISSPHIV